MDLESVSSYLVPLGILILYFIATAGKKKNPPKTQQGELEPPLPPLPRKRIPSSHAGGLPPVSRRQETLRSEIEERSIHSEVETHSFSTLLQERSGDPISAEMHKHIDSDPAYALRGEKKVSRARKLLTHKTSLRQAFLLKEILNKSK